MFDLVSHHRSFRVIAIRHRLVAAQRASSLRSQHVPRLPPFGGIGEGLTAHRVVRLGQEVNRDLCQTSRILCHPDGHSLGVSRVKSATRSVIPCGSAGCGRTFSIARGMDTFPDEICTSVAFLKLVDGSLSRGSRRWSWSRRMGAFGRSSQ
ncbi:hypothetical protein ACFPRL_12195 [Pseudoclavibacter helvolus]